MSQEKITSSLIDYFLQFPCRSHLWKNWHCPRNPTLKKPEGWSFLPQIRCWVSGGKNGWRTCGELGAKTRIRVDETMVRNSPDTYCAQRAAKSCSGRFERCCDIPRTVHDCPACIHSFRSSGKILKLWCISPLSLPTQMTMRATFSCSRVSNFE